MKKVKLTKQEKIISQELMYGLKILINQAQGFREIPENGKLRNAILEVELPTVGNVQVQLSLTADKNDFLGEHETVMTVYGE